MLITKARQLNILASKKLLFTIPKLVFFSAKTFEQNFIDILEDVKQKLDPRFLIVRSSAGDEDGQTTSFAGEYASVLNISFDEPEKIKEAVNTVIDSYKEKRPLLLEDEVIIQQMVQETSMSGVIFTHDLNTGAPYYVINYDDQSGLTDTVTSGLGEYSNRTLYVHRNSIDKLRSKRFQKLLVATQELERLMGSQFLDIEFALDEDLTPYLLQVRAITTQPNWNWVITKRIDSDLQDVQKFITKHLKRAKGVYGECTLLGQMPDWNPVEMIGRAPRALAASLYQALITDYAWSNAREVMGYEVPLGQPLMVLLAGQPFIDTRLSFHSFLPSKIPPAIAEKVVNCWIEHLKSSPELHDKVEFDVAITTYSFDIDYKINKLIGDVLTSSEKEEFKQAHLKQTRSLIKGDNAGSLNKALELIQILNTKQRKKNNKEFPLSVSSLSTMIEDCVRYGTIPFSILARHGFIAKTILLSLRHIGVISNDEVNKFLAGIQTVASDLVDDIHSLKLGELTLAEFMMRFGHLRPGTYDIMSSRYDQMDLISSDMALPQKENKLEPFQFSKKQIIQINKLLEESNFGDFNANDLLYYISEATVGREYGKFVFTRSLSDMLELLANFAEVNGLSRNEISHVPLESILDIVKNSNENNIEEKLRDISELESENHQISVAIRLPHIISDQAGVHIIPFQVSHPNFITHKKVSAQCLVLGSSINKLSLKDKVIIIEGADPGFDWIFSQKIAGLITKYGGVNSHMAIRCAEFGIPAAIGCGEQRYDMLIKSNKGHLDCAAGLISPSY